MMRPSADPDPLPREEPKIPSPPSQADVDQVSHDQALISDEWAPDLDGPNSSPAKQEKSPD